MEIRRLISEYEKSIVEISQSLPYIEQEIDKNLKEAKYFLNFISSENDVTGEARGVKAELEEFYRQLQISLKNFIETDRLDKEIFEDLKESIESSSSSLRRIDAITDISDNLKVFAINSILYSMKAGSDGRGYQVISGEFIRLSEEIAGGTAEIRHVSDEADGEIKSFIEMVSQYEEYVVGQISNVTESSDALIKQTNKSVSNFSLLLDDLLQRIGSVKEPTSRIMVGLQTQDIIQQQLQHITEAMEDILMVVERTALDEADFLPSGGEPGRGSFEARSLYTVLKHLLTVVEKQLVRLNNEILTMIEGLQNEFDQMSEAINDINQDRLHILQLVDNNSGGSLEKDSIVKLVFKTPVEMISRIIDGFDKSMKMKEDLLRLFRDIKGEVDRVKQIAEKFLPRVDSIRNMLVLAKIEQARYGLNVSSLNDRKSSGTLSQDSFLELSEIVNDVFLSQNLVQDKLFQSEAALREERLKHEEIQEGMTRSLKIIENTEEVFVRNYEEVISITIELFDYLGKHISLFKNVKDLVNQIDGKMHVCSDIRIGVEAELEEMGGPVPLEECLFKDLIIQKIVQKCTVESERTTLANEISELEIEGSSGNSITLF